MENVSTAGSGAGLRVGIVGCGHMGGLHNDAYQRCGAEVVAAVEPDEARGRQFAARTGVAWYATQTEMLADHRLDALSITVPNHLHRDLCIEALEADVAVLCEKTLAASIQDAIAIAEAVQRTGTPFQIGYMKRFHPAAERFRAMTQALGRLETGHLRCHQPMRKWPLDTWFFDPTTGGGGVLLHGASHTIDLLTWAIGRPPVSVSATTSTSPGAKVEHCASGVLHFDDDLSISFDCAWLPLTAFSPHGTGWEESIECRSRTGIARLDMVDWTRSAELPASARSYTEAEQTWVEFKPDPVDYFTEEVRQFLRCVATGSAMSPDVVAGLLTDRIVHAAYRSAASGTMEPVL